MNSPHKCLIIFLILLEFHILKSSDLQAATKTAPEIIDQKIQKLEEELKANLQILAGEIGERNLKKPESLKKAADFLAQSLESHHLKVHRQAYRVFDQPCENLEAELIGTEKPKEIIVVGAHYDSIIGCPGANDNGTGAVSILSIAKRLSEKKFKRTLRLVEFTNEEPPFFQTQNMGSVVYAKACRERKDNIQGMLSLETMGYFSDKENSQQYPRLLQKKGSTVGNFISFVSNQESKTLLDKTSTLFRKHTTFPIETAASFETIPGIGWSDQWAFWRQGYPGIMVSDTAIFRYPYYHTKNDTPDKINYHSLAIVVDALIKVIEDLLNE